MAAFAAAVGLVAASSSLDARADASSPAAGSAGVAWADPQVAADAAGEVGPKAWKFVRKIPGASCFELMRNGEFFGLTNVCARNAGTTLYIKNVSIPGGTYSMCIDQHQIMGLGVRGEYSVQGPSSWPDGCKPKSKPYIHHTNPN
ncbi:hypothetical protein [Prauserella cavernicola]|uniref:Uncharacterized protein n=1 Tax=Prauserella cavernicola TaxID=2800127 RepID=A0A934V830_9PSEU|nr:hypothetical protein [Prauserella cavernicola]MBK1789222.1 hypothetical protein [Prauserella cavernicola]